MTITSGIEDVKQGLRSEWPNLETCYQPPSLWSPRETEYRASHLVGRRLDKPERELVCEHLNTEYES